MKMKSVLKAVIFVSFLTCIFFLLAGVSYSQQDARLELKTKVEKEVKVKKQGKWVVEKVPVDNTGPRDILIYTISYQNKGKEAAIDAQIVNPIPREVVYVLGSAGGADTEVTCSIDGGQSFHKPPVLTEVKNPDGKTEKKPAPAELYTHVKWLIKKPVLPGQTGWVSFKVTVK